MLKRNSTSYAVRAVCCVRLRDAVLRRLRRRNLTNFFSRNLAHLVNSAMCSAIHVLRIIIILCFLHLIAAIRSVDSYGSCFHVGSFRHVADGFISHGARKVYLNKSRSPLTIVTIAISKLNVATLTATMS